MSSNQNYSEVSDQQLDKELQKSNKPEEKGSKRTIIIIIIIGLVLLFIVFFVVSSSGGGNNTNSTSTVYQETEGYYTTVPANSIITVTTTGEIPFGGVTANGVEYNSALTADNTYTLSSVYPSTLHFRKRIAASVLGGKASFTIPISNTDAINYVSLTSQGYITMSNGVTFLGPSPLTLGFFFKQGFPQIPEEAQTMTITYNL